MSKELLEQYKLKIGQKILYFRSYTSVSFPEIVTIKDVTTNYQDEVIIFVNEYDGYLNFSDIYTEVQIYKMFNPVQPSKYKGVWEHAHKLAELAVEFEWEAIDLIKILTNNLGMVKTIDLIKEAIEKKKGENNKSSEFVWQCPGCGHLITDTEYKAVRFDYGCPKCHITFKKFERVIT